MPATAQPPSEHAASLWAGYEDRDEFINGRKTIRFIPRKPRGIIYLFHGSGGSEAFARNTTTRAVLEPLVAAGFGFVASASEMRDSPRQWNLKSNEPSENGDIAYMLDLHNALIARGEISAATPIFTMGMSNGGGFANLFAIVAAARGFPVKAIADYMGPFPQALAPLVRSRTNLPAVFVVVGENDGLVDAKRVLAAADKLSGIGIHVETHVATEKKLDVASLSDIRSVPPEHRQLIFDDLVARGIIDAQGRRALFLDQPALTRADETLLKKRLPDTDLRQPLLRLLIETWAGHMMRSDFAIQQLAFFEAAAGG